MKVYTKVGYEWHQGQLVAVSEESYEHDGAIAECKGGGGTIDESPHAVALAEIAREQGDY